MSKIQNGLVIVLIYAVDVLGISEGSPYPSEVSSLNTCTRIIAKRYPNPP